MILTIFTNILNTALKLDPESKPRLKKLQDKVLTIELLPTHFIFQCQITEEGMIIHADEALLADTKISGTPLQMLGIALNKKNRQSFFSDDVTMEGNAEIGQAMIQLLDELQIDWEGQLARLTGDVPAYHAGQWIRKVGKWLNGAEKSFSDNIKEYLHEEAVWFPTSEALQDFCSDVDSLRMDVDRMEARIQALANKSEPRPSGSVDALANASGSDLLTDKDGEQST